MLALNQFCRLHEENEKVQTGTIFEVHVFASKFEVAVFIVHFHWISVNEQPKQ